MKNYDNLDITYENEVDIFKAIRNLPPRQNFKCDKCKHDISVSSLQVYAKCQNCGEQVKLRSFGGGSEVQDVLLIALQWLHLSGVSIPDDVKNLIDDDWSDYDEHYSG